MRLSAQCVYAAIIIGVTTLMVSAASLSEVAPPGRHFKLTADDHKNTDTFTFGKPVVGTTYFYWYDVYTGAHIYNPDGSDAMTTHPVKAAMADLSFRSPGWHYTQLRDIREAGIDFIIPVYWGVPEVYESWSFRGLPPLVAACDRMSAEHKDNSAVPAPPKIGLFYDTSTLYWNKYEGKSPAFGQKIDLTTIEGREWFYVTIRDFFSMIPPDKWARVDGKPIIFLYTSSFAAGVDDKLFDDTRKRFIEDFATDIFLVRHSDWPGRADAWYRWGGALGLTIGDHVAGLGPGYDHSAVPGREPLVVDRQQGEFYKQQWERLLCMNPQRRPWMIHVETWNEWHEGTDIARSAEYGDSYIKATARFADKFRAGIRLHPPGGFTNAKCVHWSGLTVGGLNLLPHKGDGYWQRSTIEGVPAVVTTANPKNIKLNRFLYFDVDNSYAYDETSLVMELTVVFLDDNGCEQLCVEYDNSDPKMGLLDGAFRQTKAIKVGDTGTWRTVKFLLPQARLANRANQADFRLAAAGGQKRLTIREVVARKLPGIISD